MIVDDDRTAIENLCRELALYPEMDVRGTAVNGAKGRKLIMEQHPDLLFLDVELPDIQGIRLLSEMRDEVLWDMKVVFIQPMTNICFRHCGNRHLIIY